MSAFGGKADIGKLAGLGSGQPAQVHYEVTLLQLAGVRFLAWG